jgi:hypothetical protein
MHLWVLGAKNHMIPAQCERILMARLYSLQAHPPDGIYIARTFVQDPREAPVRVLNATHQEQRFMRGSPLACCEPATMVTPPYVEQPQCKEPTSEEMESGGKHQEGPKEDAAVKPVRGLREWHRARNLAAERSGQPEERTRGNFGARKELAAAGRKMTCCAGVQRRKGHFVTKHSTKDNVRQEFQIRRMEKRRWCGPECKTGIQDPGKRRQMRLKIERTSDGFDWKAFGLEFVKQAAGMPRRLR